MRRYRQAPLTTQFHRALLQFRGQTPVCFQQAVTEPVAAFEFAFQTLFIGNMTGEMKGAACPVELWPGKNQPWSGAAAALPAFEMFARLIGQPAGLDYGRYPEGQQ